MINIDVLNETRNFWTNWRAISFPSRIDIFVPALITDAVKNEGRCFSITLLLMAVDFVNLRRVKNNILQKFKLLVYQICPDFRNSTVSWKVSMLRPFVPLVRATYR
jgi:hypothetical protein